LPLDVYHLYTL